MYSIYEQFIPEQARKVYEGKLFQVYAWKQKRFDGTFDTYTMVAHRPSAVVVPVLEDTILIQEERNPHTETFFSLPGGHMDTGDGTLEDTARRELKEETGYEVADLTVLFDRLRDTPTINWVHDFKIYLGHGLKKGSGTQLDAGEHITVHQVSFDEFIDLATKPAFRITELSKVLLAYLAREGGKEELRGKLFQA